MNNPTHDLAKEELMAYLDGELAPDRAASASAHIESCLECRRAANEFRELSQRISVWQVGGSAEEALPARLAQALEEAKEPRKGVERWHFWTRWRVAAVAVTLFVVVAFTALMSLPRHHFLRDQYEVLSPLRSMEMASPLPNRPMASAPLFNEQRSDRGESMRPGSSGVKEDTAERRQYAPLAAPQRAVSEAPLPSGPMLVRTAELALRVKSLEAARTGLEASVGKRQGYLSNLSLSTAGEPAAQLRATVRVPAQWLEPTLAELRALGHVEQENQAAEDVTRQSADLDVRLANARVTEDRLVSLLRLQTGKLSDILQVEEQMTRVRGEIEQMESERRDLSHRVAYASVNVALHEQTSVPVPKYSIGERLAEAAKMGWHSFLESLLSTAVFLLSVGLELVFWGGLVAVGGWWAWRLWRRTPPTA